MKILSLCLAFILFICPFCVLRCSASEHCARGSAYLSYEYDAPRSLLVVSVRYCGDKISAIGLSVEYNTDDMDYTSFERGGDFTSFSVLATLDNRGSVRVLAYSPDRRDEGEIVRLCFKIKDGDRSDDIRIGLYPLTEKPCAIITNGRVEPVDISFLGARVSTAARLPRMESCGLAPNGRLLLCADLDGIYFFDITIVELSGRIRRAEAFTEGRALADSSEKRRLFALDIGDISHGYVSVIVDVYGKNESNILAGREVYLFCDGKLM